jgi:hypothetical protein
MGTTRNIERSRHEERIAAHEGDAGRVHRDIGAATHGDAHIGSSERGRIVDAITDHRHHATRGLAAKRSDQLRFALGQYAGVDLVQAKRAAHSLRRAFVVAADQHRA